MVGTVEPRVDLLEPAVAVEPPPSRLTRRAEPVTQQVQCLGDPLGVGHHHRSGLR